MIRPILTPQQRRVLEYVAEGLTHTPRHTPTNDELGRAMGLSPFTISNHLTAVYDAFRDVCAPDRVAAAYAAHHLGYIDAPGLVNVVVVRGIAPPRGHRGRFVRSRTQATPESLELA